MMLLNKRNALIPAMQTIVLAAIKLPAYFLSAASGLIWAFYTAYPFPGTLVISTFGLAPIFYSFFRVKKVNRKDRIMLFSYFFLAILCSPLFPYLPLINNTSLLVICSFMLALSFYFLFFSVAVRQNAINALFTILFFSSTVSALTYGAFVVLGHDFLTQRFITGFIMIISSLVMICAALLAKATPGS